MNTLIDTRSVESYRNFLAIKSLPTYRFAGDMAEYPDEYTERVMGRRAESAGLADDDEYPAFLFDFQRDIVKLALRKKRFCVFADCGLGKTLIIAEYAKRVAAAIGPKRFVLIVSPLMVIHQTIGECAKFYGGSLMIEHVVAADLPRRMREPHGGIVITNYEALKDDAPAGNIGALILDESSMLKSHYGKWGTTCLRLGAELDWKMCCTGTPAPNDRIEYANHAVFMGAFPTVNSFLARFFVNRGQTSERWQLKPHALRPFWTALSHWSIFLSNPATYGWSDNIESVPPIKIHVHRVPMTREQESLAYSETGRLFHDKLGGIVGRGAMGQLGKGWFRGKAVPTNKPAFIRDLIDGWPGESTIIWCLYNREQELLERTLPEAASLKGSTPLDIRHELIDDFKAGRRKIMISKPKILGFGLNLQIATRQVFSGLQDSYESFYQAIKRSNRIGSTRPLNVHVPVTDIERPLVDTVFAKAKRIQEDTDQQERLFRECSGV